MMPRLRYSLKNLLILTVFASIICTVIGLPYAEYRRELVIAKHLEERGCYVEWKPSTRAWGADFFSRVGMDRAYWRVNGVEFKEGWDVKNDDLLSLSDLECLGWLAFRDSSIDGAGLAHLNDCRSLKYLDMKDNVSITDGALRDLQLTNLEHLDLDGTKVTYSGVRWITKQPSSIGVGAFRGGPRSGFFRTKRSGANGAFRS